MTLYRSDLAERIRALPKVELHQHVDGSIPAEVTWKLMKHYRLNPTDSLDEMRAHLEIQAGEEGRFSPTSTRCTTPSG